MIDKIILCAVVLAAWLIGLLDGADIGPRNFKIIAFMILCFVSLLYFT